RFVEPQQGLAGPRLAALGQRARHQIGGGARPIGHDDLDRAGRVGRGPRRGGQRGEQRQREREKPGHADLPPRFQMRVTRACSTAARPLRTASTQRLSASGTSAGSRTFSPWAPNASPTLAKSTSGDSSASNSFVFLALPSGNTRRVDSLTADQPVLSSTMERNGSLYCFAAANTELGQLK